MEQEEIVGEPRWEMLDVPRADVGPLDKVLTHLRGEFGLPDVVRALTGGMINRSYRVDWPQHRFVVRLMAADSETLRIDRRNEYVNSLAAAGCGVGPEVIAFLPDVPAMVVEFLEGETQHAEDLRADDHLRLAVDALRRLHGSGPLHRTWSMQEGRREYADVAQRIGCPLPPGYADVEGPVQRVERALARHATVAACHNDVMPENFILGGGLMRIVDYEFSGMGDPSYDVGALGRELGLDQAGWEQLTAKYYGRASDLAISRCRLQTVLWDYGWAAALALRASSGVISGTDWEPWQWACDYFQHACDTIDGPHFEADVRTVEAER